MFKLLKLEAYNFVLYKKLKIDFSNLSDNLVFIVGENKETAGSDSNGCGKSLIGDLLTDLLFDDTIRKHSPDSFVGRFDYYYRGYLSILDEDTKDIFHISKYRNHPVHKSKVRFIKESSTGEKKNLSRKKRSDTYKVIGESLNINWKTFKNRNFFGQNDLKRFLDVPDSMKGEIISDIQDLTDLQKCKDKSHKLFREEVKKVEDIEQRMQILSASIEVIKNNKKKITEELNSRKKASKIRIEQLKKECISIKEKIKYALSQSKGMDSLRKKLSVLKTDIDNFNKLLNTIGNIRSKIYDTKESISVFSSQKESIQENIFGKKKSQSDIKLDKIKKCGYCGAGLKEYKRKSTLLSYYENEIEKLSAKDFNLSETLVNLKEEFKSKEEILKKLDKEKNSFIPVVNKREKLLNDLRIKEKWNFQKKSFVSEFNIKKKMISEYLKEYKGSENNSVLISLDSDEKIKVNQLNQKQRELKEISDQKEKYEIMENAYELSMRKMFSDFLDQLNFFSNYFLGILSENDVSVVFSPKKKLKSKKIVDEITVRVSVNKDKPRDIRTYSGGEKSRINISTQLSLFSSADSPMALLFFDEPFVGVDKEGRDRIIQILRERADEGTLIIVISHEDIVRGYGNMLNVVRDNGRSLVQAIE